MLYMYYMFLLEKIYLVDENNLVFGGGMLVKKRGRIFGDIIGKLVGDCLYVCVYFIEVRGRYYEFENCFFVKLKDKMICFFEKGDFGFGVFVIEKDNFLKFLGIVFVFFFCKIVVCKIG